VKLILPYPPALNRMYRSIVIGGHSRVLLSKEARKYKANVSDAYMAETASVARPFFKKPLELYLNVTFYRPRKVGDIDGALKGLLDALQGLAFENDSQVKELHVWRDDDKANPRVEVTINPF